MPVSKGAMTLVKTDRLRRIDQIIDYFGEPRHGASSNPRPHAGATTRLLVFTEHPEVAWAEARGV